MPAGIIVYNDSGTIQIDENYQNLFVVASGTGGTIPNKSGFSDVAMVAGQSAVAERVIFGAAVSSGTKWWVLDTLPASTPDPGYGFRVWTADGKLAFDATRKPARYFTRETSVTSDATTFTYPSGRVYATSRRRGYYRERKIVDNDGVPPNIWRDTDERWRLVPVVTGNTVSFAWEMFHTQTIYDTTNPRPKGVYDNFHGGTDIYVFDMTGY